MKNDDNQSSNNGIVCFFCDATTESVVAAIQAKWIPSFFVGVTRQDGPVCAECYAKYLMADEYGKISLKPEFAEQAVVRLHRRKGTMIMVTIGDRIELVEMPEDPDPIPLGMQGTVDWVNEMPDFTQIGVQWDTGRSLMLCVPPDRYRKLN